MEGGVQSTSRFWGHRLFNRHLHRLFGVKRCSRCQAGISSSELVMRARDEVYHLHCFSCASCGLLLTKGDHFGMRDGLVYCRPHYELLRTRDYCGPVQLEEASPGATTPGLVVDAWTPAPALKGRPRKRKLMSPEPPSQDIAVNMRIHQGALGQWRSCS
ncbi:hypothetical protein AAG570_004402 [Ranatra chinensis]|uniref:LIM zinc-binding domain-containing protein n=1 Tax=Ranatra chinensis TaxID=642074 RepID=A0ABD0YMI7_9HEMI